jgi:hypothetical protein
LANPEAIIAGAALKAQECKSAVTRSFSQGHIDREAGD